MPQTRGNEPRITMRVNPEHKALIERGAAARGLSVTDFMLTLAIREAEIAITEKTVFVLSEEDYNHFVEILDRPVQDNPAVRRLFENNRNRRWKMKPE